jgi:hypothetical protein
MSDELYEQWLTEEDEFQAGWDYLTAQLAEDEDWARSLHEAFHGAEL